MINKHINEMILNETSKYLQQIKMLVIPTSLDNLIFKLNYYDYLRNDPNLGSNNKYYLIELKHFN